MRIISGKYKGRRLIAPKKLPVRPTTDMAKESLFNILNNHFNFSELRILDLFSGTGNISYEFASRGAKPITSVDADFGCINYIKKISTELDFDITTIKSDVFKFLERSNSSYDIIFADPPYHLSQEQFESIITLIFENELLEEDGMLIVEHSKDMKLDHMMHFSFSKHYGGTTFSFFEFEFEEEEDFEEENEEDF
ncbi:16S rRNA (guanine(966)-N(2))-methyltransferase RsmD [Flavobacterium haoranii]|uniref:16S rRNA (Guanine(966)-N(2))-methyltransferase RsmD n=1 Tax=Flavobacterium haoranii TaxID=683124 RepID=A0A1M6I1K1_9FLAO|nr:16S rRNA (guanine(966)-N(2))-methyltransferase RsmD [Flavobacterium haoranii]SHJ28349.1 16S rRNA (guanine(966)-N(2))-methyltransferase RsmD [Flavobacterium haoranii]